MLQQALNFFYYMSQTWFFVIFLFRMCICWLTCFANSYCFRDLENKKHIFQLHYVVGSRRGNPKFILDNAADAVTPALADIPTEGEEASSWTTHPEPEETFVKQKLVVEYVSLTLLIVEAKTEDGSDEETVEGEYYNAKNSKKKGKKERGAPSNVSGR